MDHFPARPLRRHPVAPDSASRLGGDPRYRAQPIADRPIGRRAHPICLHRPAAQAALPYLRAGVDSDGDFLLAQLVRLGGFAVLLRAAPSGDLRHHQAGPDSRGLRAGRARNLPADVHARAAAVRRPLCPNGTKIHASVSGFHSASSFGDDDSIDKNSANTNKTAPMAAANIEKTRLLPIQIAVRWPSFARARGNVSESTTKPKQCPSLLRCKLHEDAGSRCSCPKWAASARAADASKTSRGLPRPPKKENLMSTAT